MKKNCENCGYKSREENPCSMCTVTSYSCGKESDPSMWVPIPLTNGDRIRAMSDEELADRLIFYREDLEEFLTNNGRYYEYEDALKKEIEWLQQPAEEE